MANSLRDIVRQSALATSLISPRWWPNNRGHVLVVPNQHHENLYDLPGEYGHAVHDLVREIAIAMRHQYGCDGVSTRQHNEPGGNQDVWHYHVHVFPRYAGDALYASQPSPELLPAEARWSFAAKLRADFESTKAR
jgi:histidine triad (HIT) family protein